MPSLSRILRSPQGRQHVRTLFGRAMYFPVTRGRTRKYGLRPSYNESEQIPPWPGTISNFTEPEWKMNWAHLLIGRIPEQDFYAQHDIFGDGSTIVDYFEVLEGIVIEVLGFYAHYVGYDAFQLERERQRRVLLTATGHVVIYIDADDAMADPVSYLRDALRGRDLSQFARGVV